MIYLFDCCKEGCNLPAKICAQCSESCKDVCKPCERVFAECADTFNEFLNRPLGGFVFMSVWLGVIELGTCGWSLYNQDRLKGCKFPEGQYGRELGIKNWLLVQMGFAALNLLFAPYLQNQVYRKLIQEAKEPDNPDEPVSMRTKLANTENGPIRASKQDIMEAFKEVFLYDLGVLLYVLIMIASFVFSWFGAGWIESDTEACNPDNWPKWAAWSGMFFVMFAVVYGLVWYFMMVCMSSDQTLLLRGVAAAAAVGEATGRPIPGYKQAQAAGAVFAPPPPTAKPAGGLFGGMMGGAKASQAQGSNHLYAQAPQNQNQTLPPEAYAPQTPPKPSCGHSSMKLLACVGLDLMGNASYFMPGIGEAGDAVFAPASAVMLKMMFNSNSIAILGLCEELGPFTDIVPTATIAWFLTTMTPNSPITKALGLNQEWQMTGEFQK